jgi:hypothetical protein
MLPVGSKRLDELLPLARHCEHVWQAGSMTTTSPQVRDASKEAGDLVGPAARALVLEPSPPAIDDGEWFADDPVAPYGEAVILPAGITRASTTSWSAWLDDNPNDGEWVTARWLGGTRSLAAPPASLVDTRMALHRLAAYVIAPVRHQVNGKFGLRWTLGGFGTPFFGDDRQIRVEGTTLVDQRAGQVRSQPITTLQAAADFLGTTIDTETAAEHDSPPVGDVNETLQVDAAAAEFIGNWYGMAFAALESVRSDAASVDASRPQLWPGHFDPAIEIGDEDHRGSYGASLGDEAIPAPYLYASVWWPDRVNIDPTDSAWNAPSFTGAILKFADFNEGDPARVAAAFFASIRDLITR